MPNDLFSGVLLPYGGGISNQNELAELCPENFKRYNPWSDCANEIFFRGLDTSGWKWRAASMAEQKKQLDLLYALLSTSSISHEDKIAVAGWMLSEMLEEVP